MPRPRNLAKLLAGLTDAELDSIREMVKENPEVTALKQKKTALLAEVEQIDARIAALTGTRKRRGRKPGVAKPGKGVKGKPGRKPGKPVAATAGARTPRT